MLPCERVIKLSVSADELLNIIDHTCHLNPPTATISISHFIITVGYVSSKLMNSVSKFKEEHFNLQSGIFFKLSHSTQLWFFTEVLTFSMRELMCSWRLHMLTWSLTDQFWIHRLCPDLLFVLLIIPLQTEFPCYYTAGTWGLIYLTYQRTISPRCPLCLKPSISV